MRSTRWASIVRTLGMGVLGVAGVRCAWEAPRQVPATVVACPAWRGAPLSPAAAALRTARWTRLRAQRAADEERYRLEAWDPDGTRPLDFEQWRLQLLTRDRTGDLARARRKAHHALALAATPEEAGRAHEVLTLIAHEAGDHEAELVHARRLLTLPCDPSRSRPLFCRARRCLSSTTAPRASSGAATPPAAPRCCGEREPAS